MQIRRRPGDGDARASTPGRDRRLWTVHAAVTLGSRQRGVMQTDLHLAAPPLERSLAPASVFRVHAGAVQFPASAETPADECIP